MKGVILAAGKGTRMLPLTERRPKPLVPVLDRPMVEHIIVGARDAGVDHLALVVGYLGHMIQERYGDGRDLGLRLEYIWQDDPRGTGAGTLLAADFVGDEPFFLSWGDIIVAPETYANVTRVWREERPDAVLSLNYVADPWEGAAVYVDEAGYVERIIEKPPRGTSSTHYNNAGIFVFGPDVFDVLRTIPVSARGEIEMPDAVQTMLRRGNRIRGLEVIGYWSDVARPSAVLELNSVITNYRSPDGLIVSPDARVSPQARLVPPVYIGPRCRVGAAAVGPGVTLGPGTTVADGAVLRHAAVLGGNRLGARCELEYVLLEEDVSLADCDPGRGEGSGLSRYGTAEQPEIIHEP